MQSINSYHTSTLPVKVTLGKNKHKQKGKLAGSQLEKEKLCGLQKNVLSRPPSAGQQVGARKTLALESVCVRLAPSDALRWSPCSCCHEPWPERALLWGWCHVVTCCPALCRHLLTVSEKPQPRSGTKGEEREGLSTNTAVCRQRYLQPLKQGGLL